MLEQRLDKRVEKMIAAGLKDEIHDIYEKAGKILAGLSFTENASNGYILVL